MNNLKVIGKQNLGRFTFTGIEGGFGEGKRAMTVKDIAMIHSTDVRTINQSINRNIERFKNDVDIIDLKSVITLSDPEKVGYTQNAWNRSKNVYLLSERGYSKLLKILEDETAWEIYDQLVDNYFDMREQIRNPQTNENQKMAFYIPQTLAEALRLAADLEEDNQKLEIENQTQAKQIAEYEPKATYYDEILKSKGLMAVTQIAADYDLTAQKLNLILKEEGVQHKVGGQWILYKDHMNNGYTESKTIPITHSDGRPGTILHTKWTQKGRFFIHEILVRRNIEAAVDKVIMEAQK
ncbi:phage antirepressor KilAC domain-containing protein [Listeria newyorkensis]|uniref:phage antirepressor KilAC domain-containing protein n=1 Tax=Listeria newyorkensis TaxID=1497681 RepID=UPI0006925971|nr:phage antirepressor KilAC domain-containing protein [Listeria newyorkensis]SQC55329.1 Uncharacterized phage-encoded protein [Listeria newyorkensis]